VEFNGKECCTIRCDLGFSFFLEAVILIGVKFKVLLKTSVEK
jgi:hypothetical protein